jgi:hypothetical protein
VERIVATGIAQICGVLITMPLTTQVARNLLVGICALR